MFRIRAECSGSVISGIDRLFLERTYELATRGIGNTSPNPPVGAVVVRGDTIVGEGYHHRAGEPHAETNALAQADNARGATMYVSLEPCRHVGRTPPCTDALRRAGIARVVIGAVDPTQHGGASELARDGIEVVIANDPKARALVDVFARTIAGTRAYVTLKMAMSLDGYVASRPGASEWISCEEERLFVRDLRVAHDAVMVGAGTVRIDDPQLTVRPPASRLREFVRVVACASDVVPTASRIFAPIPGYARTIVLAPGGARARFRALLDVADMIYVGESQERLELKAALEALHARGIMSVLCEGGPTLAGDLIAQGLVNRVYWAISPVLLHSESAVSVLGSAQLNGSPRALKLDMLERLGCDALIGGTFTDV